MAAFKAAFDFVEHGKYMEKASVSGAVRNSAETAVSDSLRQCKMLALGLSLKGMQAQETPVC